MENNLTIQENVIKNKIYTVRGMQVMFDKDLAEFYKINTKRLNEQVKRNSERFPESFMFQLSKEEFENLWSQFATSSWGGRRTLPYAFTEQGVAMLSGVLKSDTAVRISIQIVNTFVSMRRFLTSNAQIFQRLDIVERKQIEHDNKFDQICDAMQSRDLKPEKGIFFDGQIFDSYTFVSDIIRSAKKSIVLIDNYLDDSVLLLLSKRKKDVQVTLYTKEISPQLFLDITKSNAQYPYIEIKELKQFHDRFLIIDNEEMYHIGASLKDLGKKCFAFSKFDKEIGKILERVNPL